MARRILLLIMLVLPVIGGQAQVAEDDSLALVALYQATDGANWSDNTNWLAGPVAQWFGVAVTEDRVTRLDLGINGLIGEIPVEVGNLTGLTLLDLFNNNLTGGIPGELGNLTTLTELHLCGNALTGEVPGELGNLTTLTELHLFNNNLTGGIPARLGNLTSLATLRVEDNTLTGMLPLSLTNLLILDTFWFHNTGLCEPGDEAFQTWLRGITSLWSTRCINVATEEVAEIPADFALEANYPNPFKPSTALRYALPRKVAVRLVVYDALGRRVRMLIDGVQGPGWHEVVFEADNLPSGVYVYRLQADAFAETYPMLLVK